MSLFDSGIPLDQKRITSEVCVHHLSFNDSDYSEKGSLIKWNPAVKTKADQEALLNALKDGVLDVVATDHAPHTWEEKQEAYLKAPSGLPLNQHFLLVLLDFYAQGIFSLEQIVQKTSHNIAERFQIKDRGYLREGSFADLAVVDLSDQTLVTKEDILYYCKWSPFLDHTFSGAVKYTIINGKM